MFDLSIVTKQCRSKSFTTTNVNLVLKDQSEIFYKINLNLYINNGDINWHFLVENSMVYW